MAFALFGFALFACAPSYQLRPYQVSQLIWSEESLALLENGGCPAGYVCAPGDKGALKQAARDQRLAIARKRGEPVKPEGRVRHQLSARERTVAENAVKARLKDPYSARFHDTKASKKEEGGMIAVCGHVNAKNAYGGYVGNRPYMVALAPGQEPSAAVIALGDGDDADARIYDLCYKEMIKF